MEDDKSDDSYEEGALPSSADNLIEDKEEEPLQDVHYVQTKTADSDPFRTAFVIAAHSSLLTPIQNLSQTEGMPAHMTGLGQIIESITQYTRILFEVYPSKPNPNKDSNNSSSANSDRYAVSIYSAGEEWQKINGFPPQQQNLKQIMEKFARIKVGKSKSQSGIKPSPEDKLLIQNETKILETALTRAATALFSETMASSQISACRLIMFLPSPSPYYATNEAEEERLLSVFTDAANLTQVNTTAELVLIRVLPTSTQPLVDRATAVKREEFRKGFLRKEVLEIDSLILPEAMTDLCMLHFNLRSLRITGIPMKESAPSPSANSSTPASRAIYDVILLSPSESHSFPESDKLENIVPLGSTKIKRQREEILNWKGTDKKFNATLYPSKCIHRISPLLLFSSPSSCLMKHVCAGKPVSLISSNAAGSTTASHLLLLHDSDVWLHCLYSPPGLDQYPASSFYSTSTAGYRTKEFATLVNSCLIPANASKVQNLIGMKFQPPSATSSSQFMTASALERGTRLFPFQEKDTILLAANQGEDTKKFLEPLKLFLIHYETLDEQSLDAAIDYIGRLHLISTSTEAAKIFPNQQSDPYGKLCVELVALAKRSPPSSSSPSSHAAYKKILEALQKLWPELYAVSKSPTSLAILPVADPDTGMEMEEGIINPNIPVNDKSSKKRTANDAQGEPKSFYQLYWNSKEKSTKRMKHKEFDGRL